MQSPPFFSEKKALFVSLALLEIPYAIEKVYHSLERKWNYYLDMKIINVILNELDIYKKLRFTPFGFGYFS
ncbi:unnamed protein product [Rhizophagus irregularis]|nr:unnamed protein product [Rhizophagus irregularis]